MTRRLPAIASIAGFVSLAFLLYGGILGAAWTHDDPAILGHVASHTFRELVTSAQAWRDYNPLYFFPCQLWSWKLDTWLFGADALGFRVRQLLELALAAYLLHRALRPVAGTALSAWAGAVFLAGATTAVLAQQLMSRHYVDGAVLSLASYLAFVRGSEGNRRARWFALSGGLYLLAVLSKEVFAPLPLVILLGRGRLRRDLAGYGALAAGLFAATLYRFAMVGAFPRVYRTDIWSLAALLDNGKRLAARLVPVLLGPGLPAAAAAALLASLPVLFLAREPRRLVALLGCFAVSVGPALLVADVLDARHVVALWILVPAGAAIGLSGWERRWPGPRSRLAAAAVAGAALVLVLWSNRARWAGCLEESRLYTAVWRFAFEEGRDGDVLQLPESLPGAGYAYGPTRWLRKHLGDGSAGPEMLAVSGAGLCLVDLPAGARYHTVVDGTVRSDGAFLERTSRSCSSGRRRAPLTAVTTFEDGRLRWSLGPWRGGGTYSVVILRTEPDREILAQMYRLPREGEVWFMNGPERQRFAFLFESDEGWFTATGSGVRDRTRGRVVEFRAE